MRQKGFILIFALIFLAVIGLYVLTLSEMLFIYAKSLNVLKSQHQQFYALEQALQALLQRSPNDCLSVAAHQDVDYPQHLVKSCVYTEGEYQFSYVWVDLGVYPRACVHTHDGPRASHHYSLSVWLHQVYERGLQVHWINADMGAACRKPSQLMNSGPSSWRMLS